MSINVSNLSISLSFLTISAFNPSISFLLSSFSFSNSSRALLSSRRRSARILSSAVGWGLLYIAGRFAERSSSTFCGFRLMAARALYMSRGRIAACGFSSCRISRVWVTPTPGPG